MDPPWKKTRVNEIRVGRTIRIAFTPEPTDGRDLALLSQGVSAAYLLGAIQYRDRQGAIRTTAFCRRYNLRTNEFERVENPQYEYQE